MAAVSKWVAAGSSAAVFAGVLFLGTPVAAAAPGDACQSAATQYEAALAAAGITEATVGQLEMLAQAAATAEETYLYLVEAAGGALAAELETAQAALDEAIAATAAAEEAKEEAEDSGDPDALAEAEAATEAAEDTEDAARQAVADLTAAYDAAINTPDLVAAHDTFNTAVADFEAALAGVSLDEDSAASLMGLFEAFLTACNPGTEGTDPVVTPPVTAPVPAPGSPTPVVASPVIAAPAGAVIQPVATNRGLNVQTAAEAQPGVHPGLALLAGLLAAGIAVPAGVAMRMCRLERTRN